MIRAALFACAAAVALFAPPASAEDAAAQCETVRVRVYFAPGSAAIDAAGRETLDAAARRMNGCAGAELQVRTNGDALAHARGQAVLAALRGHVWEQARIDAGALQRISAGPEFVEAALGIGIARAPAMATGAPGAPGV